MIVIGIDATKSAQQYLYYQGQAAREIVENCKDTHQAAALIAYTTRSVPLSDLIEDPSEIPGIVEKIRASKGIPEPLAAVREAALLLVQRPPPPGREHLMVVFWSMPKRPRLPLSFLEPLAMSVGAKLRLVGLQYSQPRWMRRVAETPPEIVYRRNLKPQDLARRIGC